MKLSLFSPILLILLSLSGSSSIAENGWKQVAGERAGQEALPSFFIGAERWHYPADALPVQRLPANDPARDVAFGESVRMAFAGLDPAARYELELTFLSDSDQRAQRVVAGEATLEERLNLPNGEVVRKRWPVPAGAIRSGRLEVEVQRLAGPNAVVCAVAVYCSDPNAKPLTPAGEQPVDLSGVRWPRLSPPPAKVAGAPAPALDLGGIWQFHPSPADGFWKTPAGSGWKPIQVPGEWTMQGFKVERGTAAGYRRQFTAPAAWRGRQIKLRCDGVYSDARVYVNGREAGGHVGGFTPFELDVTALVRPGERNTIALAVKSASLADTLASGMQYAAHDLGGIPRKLRLFAVPKVNVADLYVKTLFDKQYKNATLVAQVQVANESAADVSGAKVTLALADSKATPVSVKLPVIPAGRTLTQDVRLPVVAPRKWDPEHPNLYTLACSLGAGASQETVTRRVGFRQIEVRGNQVFVNGVPVKLHGVCRHETDPLRGRSLAGDQWRRDVALFREMNANFIRTSHYPPAEELVQACDELGMFVEEEGPFCWAGGNRGPEALAYCAQAELEMLLRDRSHPSVLQWSLGNETPWLPNFAAVRKGLFPKADDTRPTVWDGGGAAETDIDAPHYPGLGAPARYADAKRPTLFGEYGHLNCYNPREVYTDPGLRDIWGMGVAEMWERMRASKGVLGGSIWAGIDDVFYLPTGETVGYGEWGPLDGWRRTKPEYWHLKEIYSPVRITGDSLPLPAAGQPIRVPVENRFLFTNLSEVRFEWTLGVRKGTAPASAPPGGKTMLSIPAGGAAAGQVLELRAVSPLGFLVDAWRFRFGGPPAPPDAAPAGKAELTTADAAYTIRSGDAAFIVNRQTGELFATVGGTRVLAGGPTLMVLPLSGEPFSQMHGSQPAITPFNSPCTGWRANEVTARQDGDAVAVRIAGEYKEAAGAFTLRFFGAGRVDVAYDFKVTAAVAPRQIGVVFALPRRFETLSWQRRAQWSYYPDDHIGRPAGTAKAFPGTPVLQTMSPHTRPTWPWKDDCTPMGSNDFRALRCNILEASLANAQGAGVRLLSDGRQHARVWVEGDRVCLLAADLANEGCPACFNEFVMPRPRLAPGSAVSGTARLQLFGRVP